MFTFTAAAFALAFAAVSGGNNASTEEQVNLPISNSSQVVVPLESVVLTNGAKPTTVPMQSVSSAPSSGTVKVIQVQPKPPAVRRQVVVPFPRARTRAS